MPKASISQLAHSYGTSSLRGTLSDTHQSPALVRGLEHTIGCQKNAAPPLTDYPEQFNALRHDIKRVSAGDEDEQT